MCEWSKWLPVFASVVLIAGITSEPCAAAQVGAVKAVAGEARVNNGDKPEFRVLKAGDPIRLNDSIQTDKNSKVEVKLEDGGANSLGEYSEIYYYDFDHKDAAHFFAADVTSGSVRFVKKLAETSPPSAYTVTTPTSTINIEPGETADFVVRILNQKRTTVSVISGRIRVKNVLEDIAAERTVTACTRVDIEEGMPPAGTMGVSSRILKDLVSGTTIRGALSEDVPNCKDIFWSKKDCPGRRIWNGSRCVQCREFGMVFQDGRCVAPVCGDCKTAWGSQCVSCQELGSVCIEGRCARRNCPECAIWNGRRCVPCEEFGRVCVGGRCSPRRDCPPCSVWNGWRCVSCADFGRSCVEGRCVFRPCGECENRKGDTCVKCEDLGLQCEKGRCVGPMPGSETVPPSKITPNPLGMGPKPTLVPPVVAPLKPKVGSEIRRGDQGEKPPLKPAIQIKPVDRGSSPPENAKPSLTRINKPNISTPVSPKQGIPKQHERMGPSKGKQLEATPTLKLNERKRESSPIHPKRHDIRTGRTPETRQPAVKQENKQIKTEHPAPIGRPDLKPEFAKPDRAPGPPLGDHPGDDEKKKRR